MKTRFRLLALATALMLALSACGSQGAQDSQDQESYGELPGQELGIGDAEDSVFSLNYNSSASLNPYATNDMDNLLISQLVCENVFELDDNYNLTSRIIADYTAQTALTGRLRSTKALKCTAAVR